MPTEYEDKHWLKLHVGESYKRKDYTHVKVDKMTADHAKKARAYFSRKLFPRNGITYSTRFNTEKNEYETIKRVEEPNRMKQKRTSYRDEPVFDDPFDPFMTETSADEYFGDYDNYGE